jgi:hypothetical protein
VGPHISLIPSPHSTTRGRTASAPRLYHARTHDECSPPREGMAAAPDALPLPRPEGRPAGWMRRRSSRLPRMMLLLLPAASGGRARRAEDLKRRATGGRALASRCWRTGKHVARGAPLLQSRARASSTSQIDHRLRRRAAGRMAPAEQRPTAARGRAGGARAEGGGATGAEEVVEGN